MVLTLSLGMDKDSSVQKCLFQEEKKQQDHDFWKAQGGNPASQSEHSVSFGATDGPCTPPPPSGTLYSDTSVYTIK